MKLKEKGCVCFKCELMTNFFFGCCCFWCCGCLIGWLVILNTCVNFKCAKNQLTNNYLRNLISYLSIIKYRLLAYISPKRMVSNVDNETLLKTIKWLSTKNPPRKKKQTAKSLLEILFVKKTATDSVRIFETLFYCCCYWAN